VRASARTCYEQAVKGEPPARIRPELLRAAKWRAARYGLDADLIDAEEAEAVPAADLVGRMLTRLRPALEADRAWEEVSGLVGAVLRNGNGAARQRATFSRFNSYEGVVDFIVAETIKPA
jgi:glutamate---cysteine ligase / carboxylate-amine ligase